MGARYLTDLADQLRAGGIPTREWSGWQSRARDSGGYDPGYPAGIVVHHTASGPGSDPDGDCAYIATGADFAPVANLYLSRSGEVTVIAAGGCNHAGSGGPVAWAPKDGANSRSIGIEAANRGDGSEPWPAIQTATYSELVAVLCAAYGIPVANVIAHFEWTNASPATYGRKIDPAGPSPWAIGSGSWDMLAFRSDVTGAPTEPIEPIPPPSSGGYPGEARTYQTGSHVLAWQERMIALGWITDSPANRDSYFGDGMRGAVERMQTAFGWDDSDGVAGPHTWDHMVTRPAPPCPRCGR